MTAEGQQQNQRHPLKVEAAARTSKAKAPSGLFSAEDFAAEVGPEFLGDVV
jgi:hypothetical protein